VHGNYYGTSRLTVEQEMKTGTDILLEIDWQGARQVKKQFPDAAGIFILPPSIAALEERLHKRGTDEPHIITRRLLAAGGEIAHAPEFEYAIINEEFNVACPSCRRLSKRHEHVSPSRQPAMPRCLPSWESTRKHPDRETAGRNLPFIQE
jgi:guanylate kinase